MKKYSLLLTAAIILSFTTKAQPFTEDSLAIFTGLRYSSADWGDYDNDGDLDLIITGNTSAQSSDAVTKLYRNNGPSSASPWSLSEQSNTGIINVYMGAVAWGDYNNDGLLDLAICGFDTTNNNVTKLYKNTGNGFTEVTATTFQGVRGGNITWADYDNDGLIDLLLSGYNPPNSLALLYKNMGNDVFILQKNNFINTQMGSSAWGDLNSDGLLDLVLAGQWNGHTIVYYNSGNSFVEDTILSGGGDASLDLGDYDGDGDLDILVSYRQLPSFNFSHVKLYRNDAGIFTEQTNIGLANVATGNAQWGDYDNDGDLDILLVGMGNSLAWKRSTIYKNNGPSATTGWIFTEQTNMGFAKITTGTALWNDYDNDGDLDVFISGASPTGNVTKLYKNNSNISNLAPSAPTNLTSTLEGNMIRLNWNSSTDNITPDSLLSYNIRIGTSSGGQNLNSPEADSTTGFRRIVYRGLVKDTFCYIKPILRVSACTPLYFSVQAIDQGFMGSSFSSPLADTNQWIVNAGSDTIIHIYDTLQLHLSDNSCGTPSYSWAPANTLSASNITHPKAFPLSTTTYSVTVTDNAVQKTDSITVFVADFEKDSSITNIYSSTKGALSFDVDNDGDMDILAIDDTLISTHHYQYPRLFLNNNGLFTETTNTGFPVMRLDDFLYFDFNNDGKMDVLFSARRISNNRHHILIYLNTGNGYFTQSINNGIDTLFLAEAADDDINNDGLSDLLVNYFDINYIPEVKVFLHTKNNAFKETFNPKLNIKQFTKADWVDIDNDGYRDLFVSGYPLGYVGTSIVSSSLYKNIAGNDLQKINLKLPLNINASAFTDYNSDGFIDIIVNFKDSLNNYKTVIYKNLGGNSFIPIYHHNLPNVRASAYSSIASIDYDNDGDADIIFCGYFNNISKVKVYLNKGNGYYIENKAIEINRGFDLVSINPADIDNDKDIDFLLSAYHQTYSTKVDVYKNLTIAPNQPPSKPNGLSYDSLQNRLYWSASIDDHTPSQALNYNLAIGTTPNGVDILSPDADLSTGYRKVVALGNRQKTNFAKMNLPFDSIYYVRVQAIDDSYQGSLFSDSIRIHVGLAVQAGDFTLICGDTMQILAAVNTSDTNLTYSWSPGIGLSDSTVLKPMVFITQPTAYTLTVSKGSYTTSKQVMVSIGKPDYNIDFSALKTQFDSVPFTVDFLNKTTDSANYIFIWNFGDGTTLTSNDTLVSHTYTHSGVYNVNLAATNTVSGCSDSLKIVGYVNCSVSGIKHKTTIDYSIRIIPNPNHGNFILQVENVGKDLQQVMVLNMMGEVIFSEDITAYELSAGKKLTVPALSKGIYFAVIISNNQRYVKKFIVL